MDYILTCEDTLKVVSALLSHQSTPAAPSLEHFEAAFWHLRSCASCSKTLTPSERGRFTCEVALVRD